MELHKLIEQTRTVRRFDENKDISQNLLLELVDAARLSGSARNAQLLKYMIITERDQRQQVFPLLGWAGYLTDWKGPGKGEKPNSYIICLLDHDLLKGTKDEAHFDCGIATQNMLLTAAAQGVYGCRIGAFSNNINEKLNIEKPLSTLLVVALGYPGEEIVLEEVGPSGDVKYWRDEKKVHHVPKRTLKKILVTPSF